MKKLLLFLVLIAPALISSAQDVIVKKDGSTIMSKIIEIGINEVKYKKWSNQDGPNYTISISDIKEITYENGEKDVFKEEENTKPQQLDNNDYSRQMAENLAINNRLEKERLLSSAKSWRTVGSVWYWINVIGGIGGGIYLYIYGAPESTYWIVAGSGFATAFVGLFVFNSIANNKEAAANSIAFTPIINHDFNIGNNTFSASLTLINDKQANNTFFGAGLSYKF